MADLGKLCYKKGGSALCYKKGGSALVYKAEAGDWATVTFAWGVDAKDLDICAYWDGAPSLQMGFGHNTSTSEQVSGAYHILYSGDITSSNASEWCKIKMAPWGDGSPRTFRVHFNFYGFHEDYPGSECTVIASQSNGKTFIKRGQPCGTANGQPANTGSPSCLVTFDSSGKLISLD